jgi:hypothetical protein
MTMPIAILSSVALICITAFITPVALKGMDMVFGKKSDRDK